MGGGTDHSTAASVVVAPASTAACATSHSNPSPTTVASTSSMADARHSEGREREGKGRGDGKQRGDGKGDRKGLRVRDKRRVVGSDVVVSWSSGASGDILSFAYLLPTYPPHMPSILPSAPDPFIPCKIPCKQPPPFHAPPFHAVTCLSQLSCLSFFSFLRTHAAQSNTTENAPKGGKGNDRTAEAAH